MNDATKRRLIALKSPQSTRSDGRPRCEDCGRVLVRRDFLSYWDGDAELERQHAVPRCCDDCAELVHERKSA